jgi:hypothetical protein
MIDFLISGAPVANIILIVTLFIGASRIKPFPFMMFFFIYGTFHYTYAVPAVFAGNLYMLGFFHNNPNISALVAEVLFFIIWTFFVIKDAKEEIAKNSNCQKIFLGLLSLYSIIFLLYHLFPAEEGRQLFVVKDNISLLLMLFFSYMFSILFQKCSNGQSVENLKWLIFSAIFVLAVGLYEVLYGFSWTTALLADGQSISRASGTMFNPNVLGLWGMSLVLFSFYLLDQKKVAVKYTAVIFLFGTVGIYISGSRTSLILCIALMLVLGILKILAGVKFNRVFRHAIVFIGLFFMLCYSGTFYRGTILLSKRFLSMPVSIVNIVADNEVNPDITTSIYGRLGIEEATTSNSLVSGRAVIYDNAYLALKSYNYTAFITWVSMLLIFITMGFRRFWKEKNIRAAYALSALAGFIMIGFIIRAYQVFPVWGLSSLMLTVFIVWLSGSYNVKIPKEST